MGRLNGKRALVTGAARGQGRAHAIRLAQEGAEIVALDIAQQIPSVEYPMPTRDDLEETVRLVRAVGGAIHSTVADVRDRDALTACAEALGPFDIVVANAGIYTRLKKAWELEQSEWNDVIDVNLTGGWNTVQAAIPAMIERGQGGSIILISSVLSTQVVHENLAPYIAAKHGLVGLMRAFALELAPYAIRVNVVNPGTIDTPMTNNEVMYGRLRPDLEAPGREEAATEFRRLNALDVPWIDSAEVSSAVAWLASEEARYVTGTSITVDAGQTLVI